MPKEYFCRNRIDNIDCGETEIEKFEKGRYSICKKCRIQKISGKNSQRKHLDILDKIKKIDPKEEIQTVVEYSLKYKNFNFENSIFDNIQKITEDNRLIIEDINTQETHKNKLFQNLDNLEKKYEQVRVVFNLMKERIQDLELDIIDIKKKINIDISVWK